MLDFLCHRVISRARGSPHPFAQKENGEAAMGEFDKSDWAWLNHRMSDEESHRVLAPHTLAASAGASARWLRLWRFFFGGV
jgi:hypothetical protein